MAVVLGLLVSLTYGAGDFFGGLAAKRARAGAVVLGSFALSTVLLVVATSLWWSVGTLPAPRGRDLALGAATGVVGPAALGLLYHGLAVGRMSVVAPITAVLAAVVPFTWGLATGDRPGALAVAGVVVALVAVGFISGAPEHADTLREPGEAPLRSDRGVVAVAVGAGLGFGVVYVLLGSTTDDAGLWPLLVARPLAVVLATGALTVLAVTRSAPVRSELAVPPGARSLVAAAGVLDVGANTIYLAATRQGLLSIVAVLSSLYPAATVVLARVVLGERLHRQQVAGLVLAAAGVTAIGLG
jgi:drug/metabolite transporter (DMT)-like permease